LCYSSCILNKSKSTISELLYSEGEQQRER
jgi:hypothetical protein